MSRKSPIASRPSYFRRTDEGVPELSGHPAVEPVERREVPTVRRVKRTWYVPHDVVIALDRLQLEEFERTGTKPELSNLVAEAITLLVTSRQPDAETA